MCDRMPFAILVLDGKASVREDGRASVGSMMGQERSRGPKMGKGFVWGGIIMNYIGTDFASCTRNI